MPLPTDVTINAICAFRDNYIWMLQRGRHVVLVDPGDAAPVLDVLRSNDLIPVAILATHHHSDHVGGIAELRRLFAMPVYGPADEPIPDCTHPLHGNDRVTIPELDLQFQVLSMPGHTRAAIAYAGQDLLFCGDTLFCGGCGRIFEGTARQLYQSLQRLAQLPATTQVFCAHEYTLDNLLFAREVEPANAALGHRLAATRTLRVQGSPTVPSTLADELATNPFLRCDEIAVQRAAQAHIGAETLKSAVEIFTVLRRWKDNFRAG